MVTLNWDPDALLGSAVQALREHAKSLDLEQAVYGLDHLDELALHPILAAGFEATPLEVAREVIYPLHRDRPSRSQGIRCDLVLSPQGMPLREETEALPLFVEPETTAPEQAYWLEVKAAAQHMEARVNPGYASLLTGPVGGDVLKLRSDPVIRHAGLLVIRFAASEAHASDQLHRWRRSRAAEKLPWVDVNTEGFALNNRAGNGWCAVTLITVRRDDA